MTDDQHGQHGREGRPGRPGQPGQPGQGTPPPSGGRWDPLPQGDYDDGATAFVELPEGGIDALLSGDSPLAAPGHGYVPPQITVAPAPSGATDPAAAATGSWAMPAGGAEWPEPAGAAGQPTGDDRFTYNPGATGQWTFEEPAASASPPGQDVTGQWSIPVAGGDLPDESGEFTTSSLIDQWGGTPPATLPGGAPAPWATGASGRPWGQEPVAEQGPGGEYGGGEYGGGDAGAEEGHAGAYGGEQGLAPGHPGHLGHPGEPPHAGDSLGAGGAQHAGEAQHPGGPDHGAAPHGMGEQRSGVPHSTGDAPQPAGEGHQEPPYPAAAAPPAPEPSYEPAPAAVEAVQHAPGDAEAPRADDDVRGPREAAEEAHGAAETAATTGTAETPETAEATPDTAHARVPDTTDGADSTDAPPADAPQDPASPEGTATEAADPRAGQADQGAADVPAPLADEHPLASYVLRVNGSDRPVTDAWIGESLLYVLRERLGLAGAKDGCSQGECGACNVQVDGRLVASCLVPAVTTAGSEVRTVEGLAADGQPSDVQRALARCGAVQCGFCVPGMAMTLHDLLEGNPAPTELETRQALCGNLCRCSGYRGVLRAVKEVVAERETQHTAAGEGEQDGDEVRIPHQGGPSVFEAPGAMEAPDQSYGTDGGQA
ncbi:2Fe-2S iron-sulfur cluster-binding protein [Streptomyces sp. NPDC018693]|uniref:2Fe-2S iron-sulfur cluster-binding protein n=1 Tax=unclassified Streptomyces TaxID=2593676 RepID=UPI00378CD004